MHLFTQSRHTVKVCTTEIDLKVLARYASRADMRPFSLSVNKVRSTVIDQCVHATLDPFITNLAVKRLFMHSITLLNMLPSQGRHKLIFKTFATAVATFLNFL